MDKNKTSKKNIRVESIKLRKPWISDIREAMIDRDHWWDQTAWGLEFWKFRYIEWEPEFTEISGSIARICIIKLKWEKGWTFLCNFTCTSFFRHPVWMIDFCGLTFYAAWITGSVRFLYDNLARSSVPNERALKLPSFIFLQEKLANTLTDAIYC